VVIEHNTGVCIQGRDRDTLIYCNSYRDRETGGWTEEGDRVTGKFRTRGREPVTRERGKGKVRRKVTLPGFLPR